MSAITEGEYTSFIGDVWQISDTLATPIGGDRKFGLNEQMSMLLEGATKNEACANILRFYANAPLNESKDALLLPDSAHDNWLRSCALSDPTFDTAEEDYFYGVRLIYPADTRLHIEQGVVDPGSMYGPYYVGAKGDDNQMGIVGIADSWEDLKGLLERLKGTMLSPMPVLTEGKSKVIDFCEGYRAEVRLVGVEELDFGSSVIETTVVDVRNEIVFQGFVKRDTLLEFRQSKMDFEAMLATQSKEKQGAASNTLGWANESLKTFAAIGYFKPSSPEDLTDMLNNIRLNCSIKLLLADGESEILVTATQPGSMPKETRHLTFDIKYVDGFALSSKTLSNKPDVEVIFALINDKAKLTSNLESSRELHPHEGLNSKHDLILMLSESDQKIGRVRELDKPVKSSSTTRYDDNEPTM